MIQSYACPVCKFLFLLTDDDGVVVGNEHLAVHIYQFSHQLSLQLSVGPQTPKRDVIHPLIPHCRDRESKWLFLFLFSFDIYTV